MSEAEWPQNSALESLCANFGENSENAKCAACIRGVPRTRAEVEKIAVRGVPLLYHTKSQPVICGHDALKDGEIGVGQSHGKGHL
jgi:hypothetical protein